MLRAALVSVLLAWDGCVPQPPPPQPIPVAEPIVNDAVTWESKELRRAEQAAIKSALKQVLPEAGGGRLIRIRCSVRPCVVAVYGNAAQKGRDRVIADLVPLGFSVKPKGRAGPAGKGYKWLWVFPLATGGLGPATEAASEPQIKRVWAEALHVLRPGSEG
ncbi:MAG: hypothetical protein AB8H79_14475 [Myxococcota bacterium]